MAPLGTCTLTCEPGVKGGSSVPSGIASSKLRMPSAASYARTMRSGIWVSACVWTLIVAATASDAVRLVGGRVEDLVDRHQPRRQPLPVVMAQEGLEGAPVRRDPVRPVVVAQRLARGLQLLLD